MEDRIADTRFLFGFVFKISLQKTSETKFVIVNPNRQRKEAKQFALAVKDIHLINANGTQAVKKLLADEK